MCATPRDVATPANDDRPAIELAPRARWTLMSVLALASVLAALDSSFVPLAFSDLIDDLDTSTGTVVWVALGYLAAATGPMLFLARVGDRIGHWRLFQLGIALYSAAMAACSLAPDVASLIAIRVAQGLGMAAFLPPTFSLATQIHPPSRRGRALGVLASANSAGFVLGPIFAGWLLDSYDWRSIFASRIPLAAIIVLAAAVMRPTRRPVVPAAGWPSRDWKGATFLSVALFGLLYGLNRLPVEDNHLDPKVWAVALAGVVFLALFVRRERRADSPLVDVELYRTHPAFAKASIAFFAMFASFPVYLFVLPLLLIAGFELPAWDAGMLLAIVAVITFVVSPWAGRLADRLGPDIPCTLGALLELAGYLALLGVGADYSPPRLILPMVLFGFGSGLFFSPNNRLMMSSVPPEQAGMASGMIGTVRQAGYAAGFAVSASLFSLVQNRHEEIWTRRGFSDLGEPGGRALARIFDEGGVWSPEMLVYILHLGAVLSAALLLVTVVYSLPRLRFDGRRHLGALGGAAAIAAAAVWLFVATAEVWHSEGSTAAETAGGGAITVAAVAPFGFASRLPRDVPAFAPPLLESGQEVFAFYCSDCHGIDARGVEGRGVDLVASEFLQRTSDRELADYLRVGRAADAPESRTGLTMPGMATMPTFDDTHYPLVIAYLRELG